MRLDDIGFYTLNDERARRASRTSPLRRCEILLTDACNFKCPYCRGPREDCQGTLPIDYVKRVIDLWAAEKLFAIRFSGGEPTVYRHIREAVGYAASKGVQRIALSTNGSARPELYQELVALGANDFSVSFDGCCAADSKAMAGGVDAFKRIVSNIRMLSSMTYVTVGVVLTEDNVGKTLEIIQFAHDLGVADIRIISSAQYNQSVAGLDGVEPEILGAHPILRYRVSNFKAGRGMRGLSETDNRRCPLVLDDMAVAGQFHFPCIIYLREGGAPIGRVGESARDERTEWSLTHVCYADPICRGNCLDVCVDYNNRWLQLQEYELPRWGADSFNWQAWRVGEEFLVDLQMKLRWENVAGSDVLRRQLRANALGWCPGEELQCRPKSNAVAVMFKTASGEGWVHLQRSEFHEVFRAPKTQQPSVRVES